MEKSVLAKGQSWLFLRASRRRIAGHDFSVKKKLDKSIGMLRYRVAYHWTDLEFGFSGVVTGARSFPASPRTRHRADALEFATETYSASLRVFKQCPTSNDARKISIRKLFYDSRFFLLRISVRKKSQFSPFLQGGLLHRFSSIVIQTVRGDVSFPSKTGSRRSKLY